MEVKEFPSDHNLKCHVCGENRFEEREGFYYCQECGTKQEQVRLISVEQDDEFNTEKVNLNKTKIKTAKPETPKLTSWECYNYILRGLVEELLSLGAKEELKLTCLQVWAAYLRCMEVAFFNRKKLDLPKLGVRYIPHDAQTIYNHKKQARKKRKRSDDISLISGSESKNSRSWRRTKRKLDESNYSLMSATTATSAFTGLTSSTSAVSNKAIKIEYNSKAKAFLKKLVPVKHLEKHLFDADGDLLCHKQPKTNEVKRPLYRLMLLNLKQIYSILAVSLNLIGDDIQLCDLVRFIREGHIGKTNVMQYFPENISGNVREILTNIDFYRNRHKYSEKCIRDHINVLCRNIGIFDFRNPNFIKLVERYTKELSLPTSFAAYIERLINLLPPQFKTRAVAMYPGYEARALAYIIFTLKLFFGLDGYKEHRISQASQNLNSKIELLNRKTEIKKPLLFVYNEWVEYIEMRKIIISRYSDSYCEQFKQCRSSNQRLEQMAADMRKSEDVNLLNDKPKNPLVQHKIQNFNSIFERFLESCKNSETDKQTPTHIEFSPTLTPSPSYLQTILQMHNNNLNSNNSCNINIPDFMSIDHTQRDINSYLEVKPLITYFKKHKLKLNVDVLATTENRQYVGIFRSPRLHLNTNFSLQKACFDICDDDWVESIKNSIAESVDDLKFKTELTPYPESHFKKRTSQLLPLRKFRPRINDAENRSNVESQSNIPENHSSHNQNEADAVKDKMEARHAFNENNMDPIEISDFIAQPRKNLENIDLFEGISDEESVLIDDDENDVNIADSSESVILSENEPSVSKEFVKVEPLSPPKRPRVKTSEKNRDKTPKAKDSLKMCISNMECWMLLGTTVLMNKAPRDQLKDKLPNSFIWLLDTCADTIDADWTSVFEQLLCIETMFCLGINDPKTIKNCVYLQYNNPIKEIQWYIKTYRGIW